ncbi:TonB-dependent receptor plug domain-containing protein [Sphingomicrobium aestuariivivum]|uniref:TonB-dependent receptor plug domain-containing protein n=1 Tax=Sphingomicrobium aestuariivivum TaxID=1582356 RepID=UPI001FD6B115|nr:TonB-dependent receptor plug domain-containing protein [Sphingomicrobium aestuariivivum]MCJ8191256.1 TonB-dependent receptor [Sphingomicrobium aestuariivivum]
MVASQIALGLALLQAAPQEAPETPREQPVPVEDFGVEGDSIIVTGTRPRGSVIGDVDPVITLDARDIRSTGATSVSELLEALAPELGSTRGRGGGRPILLVDGRRISGFRELRDLPAEAIERVDILPEEVALKYGYRADQRVVNFVLRENFFSTTLETEARFPTAGGRFGGEWEVDRLMLSPGKRTTFNFDYEFDGLLTEDERDIVLEPVETADGVIDPRPLRSLVSSEEQLQLSSVIKRPIGEATGTINVELSEAEQRGLLGPAIATIDVPAGSPFGDGTAYSLVRDSGLGALERERRTREGALAFVVNSAPGDRRWSTTGNLEVTETRTLTDRGPDVAAIQDGLDALDPAVDPTGAFAFAALSPRDRARSTVLSTGVDGLLSGDLFKMPAGTVTTSLRAGATYLSIDSASLLDGVAEDVFLDRRRLFAAASLDVPLLDDSAIGSLSANINGGVEDLSDFGTLTIYGAGLNWEPTGRLDLLASFTVEEGAPGLSQLGDPQVTDPAARVLDLVTGETVIAAVTTGGNPALLADSRTVWKLGANYELPIDSDDWQLSLRGDFTSTRIDDPIGGFPELTPEIEATFPERVTRDADGRLVALDVTPINYAEERRDALRWGLNFRKNLAPKPPSEATINRFRERFRGMRGQAGQAGRAGPPRPEGEQGPPSPPQQRPQGEGQQPAAQAQSPQHEARRGGGRFGRFSSARGPRGGRLYGSITHEVNFTDQRTIVEGGPVLDFTDGASLGRFGGRSRHKVESRLGIFNNGFGARVSVDWYGATRVDSGIGELRYDDYGTVDLRLYANLTERLDLMAKHPWLRGTSVRIAIDNVLDQRPRVTNENGEVPLAYQPSLLVPEGRTFAIQFRKLFVPRRFIREERERRRAGS